MQQDVYKRQGEVMVVLVTASPIFPSKRNFTNALLKAHPEITTVVQNVNNRTDSLILGDKMCIRDSPFPCL